MPTRRDALVLGAAGLGLTPFIGCGRDEALPPGAIRVPLADLPEGARVIRMRIDEPLELRRIGSDVRARSLFCPHFGCRLAWDHAAERYNCPCHGGAFDADGRPVAGPPTERMRELPVSVGKEWVIVMPRPRGGVSKVGG